MRDEGAKKIQNYGVGSTIKVPQKSLNKTLTYTKIGDDQWVRSSDNGQQDDTVYSDLRVAGHFYNNPDLDVHALPPQKTPEKNEVETKVKQETEKAEEKAAEQVTNDSPKYQVLNERSAEISKSDKSVDEKRAAYVEMLDEVEPGTTFRIKSIEMRKGDDPEYPYEYIDSLGNYKNATRNVDYTIMGRENDEDCLVFFDKDKQIKERKATVSKMKESGEFEESEKVHAKKEGKITVSSDDFGSPGEYVAYRNGNVGSSGMVFFAPKKEGADSYAFAHNYGNTGEYSVTMSKPLVIRGNSDVDCIRQAYNTLHPDSPVKGDITSSKWISCDKKNATALNSGVGGYDGIVYIINGKPSEIQVSAKKAKKDVTKTGEYTTTEWSRLGYTYEEAVMRGYADETAKDYKRVDSNSDGFGDDGLHCSFDRYEKLLFLEKDGGPGSGNWGHEGIEGKVGGSKKSGRKQPENCKNGKGDKGHQSRYAKVSNSQKALMNASIDEIKSIDATSFSIGSKSNPEVLRSAISKYGLDDAPKVLTKSEFEQKEKESPVGTIYRGVEPNEDLGMSSTDIAKQTMYGEKTYVGSGFESSGLYFSGDKSHTDLYSKNNGTVMKACVDKDAATISFDDLIGLCESSGINDTALCALYHGYEVVTADYGDGDNYCIALTRRPLIFEEITD